MSQNIHFTKMHGCGNDYVYVNCFTEHVGDAASLSRFVSDRHFGVGADGLVLIGPSTMADVRMRIFNADGSEAEMCGNASRCVAKYVYDHGIVRERVIRIETGAGLKVARLLIDEDRVTGATVDMGEPILAAGRLPLALPDGRDPEAPFMDEPMTCAGRSWLCHAVSMGNPHNIIFLGDDDPALEDLDLEKIGPEFENHALFPERVNTEFVRVESVSAVSMRVWERGSGETMACGTGACATAVACIHTGRTDRTVDVKLKGGTLRINWNPDDNHVYMTGPAVAVFDGVLAL